MGLLDKLLASSHRLSHGYCAAATPASEGSSLSAQNQPHHSWPQACDATPLTGYNPIVGAWRSLVARVLWEH